MSAVTFAWTGRAGAPQPPGDERERVLDAALEAFLDFGIRRTSMGEIARRSRLSPATLYRRFNGKDDVVGAVGRREIERLLAAVDAEVDRLAPPDEQVIALFSSFLRAIRDNRLLQRLLTTEPDVVLPLLTVEAGPVVALGREYLAGFLRDLQTRLALPPTDVGPVAEVIARVALSLALTPQTCLPLDRADEGFRDVVHQFLGGVLSTLAPPAR
ncbi:MAG TPA: TetR/AcrR family transcriptional regulator [Acidimicrobiales bacterium]|nr:TetR/AcrR family transcriptional regulator [Acidimicrobiales bacterium]